MNELRKDIPGIFIDQVFLQQVRKENFDKPRLTLSKALRKVLINKSFRDALKINGKVPSVYAYIDKNNRFNLINSLLVEPGSLTKPLRLGKNGSNRYQVGSNLLYDFIAHHYGYKEPILYMHLHSISEQGIVTMGPATEEIALPISKEVQQ